MTKFWIVIALFYSYCTILNCYCTILNCYCTIFLFGGQISLTLVAAMKLKSFVTYLLKTYFSQLVRRILFGVKVGEAGMEPCTQVWKILARKCLQIQRKEPRLIKVSGACYKFAVLIDYCKCLICFAFVIFWGDVENTRYLKQKLNFHYTHWITPKRVSCWRAHLCVFGRHSPFWRKVTCPWQHCLLFDLPGNEFQTSRSWDKRFTIWPTGQCRYLTNLTNLF